MARCVDSAPVPVWDNVEQLILAPEGPQSSAKRRAPPLLPSSRAVSAPLSGSGLGGGAFAAVGLLAAAAAATARSGQRPLLARAFAAAPQATHYFPAQEKFFGGSSSSSSWWPWVGYEPRARRRDRQKGSAVGAPSCALRASFSEYTAEELRQALQRLGVSGFGNLLNGKSGTASKGQLVQVIQSLDLPYRHVNDALRAVKGASNAKKARQRRQGPASKGRASHESRGRSGGGGGAPDELQGFRPDQLRSALNVVGIKGTHAWPKRRLVNKLQELGVSPWDVKRLLRDHPTKSNGSPRGGGSRNGASSCGPRWQERGRQRKGRPGRSPRRSGDWTYIGAETVDELHFADDLDDFEDFTMGGERWDKDWDDDDYEDDDYVDASRDDVRWGGLPPHWHWEQAGPNFRTYRAHASERGASASNGYGQASSVFEEETAESERESFWRDATLRAGGARPAQPLESQPDQAMERALAEGWSTSGLSRLQALQLLGLCSVRPTAEEVRSARRQLAQRWHPDRNPGDERAASAFQLVMAAGQKLS